MKLAGVLHDAAIEIVEHYNDHHADSVLFVAEAVFATRNLSAAEIADVERDALVFRLYRKDGIVVESRHTLSSDVVTRDDVAAGFTAALQAGRAQRPHEPLTSIEQELASTRALPTWPLEVTAVQDLNPHLRQITFKGDLSAFRYPGFDAFMFFFVPPEGGQLPDGFNMAQWRAMGEGKPAGAYYTIRAWREGEMICWFVLHDTYGAVSDWASRAKTGDCVAAWGPRVAFAQQQPETHYFLFVDETALGAAAAILDQLPATARVSLFAEIDSPAERVTLGGHPQADVNWLYRQGNVPGESAVMRDAVTLMTPPEVDDYYVYIATEAAQARSVKQYIKAHWKPAPGRLRSIGYWRKS